MDGNAVLLYYDTRVNYFAFWSVICIGCLIFILYLSIKRLKVKWREVLGVLLSEYVVTLILLTVVLRETPVYPEGFHNSLLCDKSYLSGNLDIEHAVNVALFLPMGMLLYGLVRGHRFLYTILIGIFVSFIIEISQYVLNKGVADIEDIICNGIGLMLGALFCMTIIKCKDNILF